MSWNAKKHSESISNYKKIKETLKSDANMIFKFVMFFCYIFLQAMGKPSIEFVWSSNQYCFPWDYPINSEQYQKEYAPSCSINSSAMNPLSRHMGLVHCLFLHRQYYSLHLFSWLFSFNSMAVNKSTFTLFFLVKL